MRSGMKKINLIMLVYFLYLPFMMPAQSSLKHFNLSTIKTIEGAISKVSIQKGYHHHDFLYITLISKKHSTPVQIEVAPLWFVPVKLKSGDRLTVVGARIRIDDKPLIIAQYLILNKKKISLRDDYGFPLWRGGRRRAGKGMGRRRQRRGQF
jgi:hypothetical protein